MLFTKQSRFLTAFLFCAVICHAQYRGDHIPGFIGLGSGTLAPPGIYVGNLVYIYNTGSFKENNGQNIRLPSLTSTADVILFSIVTNYKLLGADVGGSVGIPFMKNRIEVNASNLSTNFAFTDMFINGSLGWHLKRGDITTGYNGYFPTGEYVPGASDNTGLGIWGNEFTLGGTVYLDQHRMWNASAMFGWEFNTEKSGTNIRPGQLGTIEGGLARTFYKKTSGPIPIVMNLGAAGYTQFKITGDSGSDIPPELSGYKDHVFALGPEFNIFIPNPGLTFLVRYEPEFGARNRTQGHTIVFNIGWVVKSLVKHQP